MLKSSINPLSFPTNLPDSFLFGLATAAYQIEGAADIDGRGPSIWDAFSHTENKVKNNDNGDVACDHYHLWESDLDLLKSMHVDAYRFSFSWPRIQPDGRGAINEKGLAFYDRLIDGCLDRGLQPFATLYHWDLPLALHQDGGWTHRDTAHAFANYAALITERFGDRLATLTTFNEPWCSSMLGYLYGVHAPGTKDLSLALKTVHFQHLGHALAVQRIKQLNPSLKTGIVLNLQSVYSGTDSEADHKACARHEIFHNGIYLEPLFQGHYPAEFVEELGQHLPPSWEQDMATMNQPLDFWGLNYYCPARVVHHPGTKTPYPRSMEAPANADVPRTDIGWEIDASSLHDLLLKLYKNYQLPPCYITENGACFNEEPVDGDVQDSRRLQYLQQHIQAVNDACCEGIPIHGYFAWSLMDNFEWAEGYTMRFGLVHVDYETQVRTIKESGKWYATLALSHRASKT